MTTLLQLQRDKLAAIDAAGRRCQGSPKYPACRARDGQAHPETDKPVTLRAIRIVQPDGAPDVLHVMCDRCMLGYDILAHRAHERWRESRISKGNGELFPIDNEPVKRDKCGNS